MRFACLALSMLVGMTAADAFAPMGEAQGVEANLRGHGVSWPYSFTIRAHEARGDAAFTPECAPGLALGPLFNWEINVAGELVARLCPTWNFFGGAHWEQTGVNRAGEPSTVSKLHKTSLGYEDDFVFRAECTKHLGESGATAATGHIVWRVGYSGIVLTPVTACNWGVFGQRIPPADDSSGPCETYTYWRSEFSAGAIDPPSSSDVEPDQGIWRVLESLDPDALVMIEGIPGGEDVMQSWCDTDRIY